MMPRQNRIEHPRLRRAALSLLLALPILLEAKVSQQEADQLRSTLTPLGGERAGNKAGTIPDWQGGLVTAPDTFRGAGQRYTDPFADDRPLLTITAANLSQYQDQLSPGQQAMLKRHPDSYRLKVYPSRRSAAAPQSVYEATYRNALQAELGGGGESLSGANLGIPFPIPKDGQEPIWNHRLRYRGVGVTRWNNQAAVTVGGDFNLVKFREDWKFPYSSQGAQESPIKALYYLLQTVTEPARLAGTITLIHESADPVRQPRRTWRYNPGQRRLRPATNVGYDNPVPGADGLLTADQTDSYNGATDRYSFKLAGRREMFVPYNAYGIHSDTWKVRDIVKPGHLNQELARYELHRVWIVDATVRPGAAHLYKRRTFYIDEDSWQILLVDLYDSRDELWRWQEAHTIVAYDKPFTMPVLETVYDLKLDRYLVQAMNNEDAEAVERAFDSDDFDPVSARKRAGE